MSYRNAVYGTRKNNNLSGAKGKTISPPINEDLPVHTERMHSRHKAPVFKLQSPRRRRVQPYIHRKTEKSYSQTLSDEEYGESKDIINRKDGNKLSLGLHAALAGDDDYLERGPASSVMTYTAPAGSDSDSDVNSDSDLDENLDDFTKKLENSQKNDEGPIELEQVFKEFNNGTEYTDDSELNLKISKHELSDSDDELGDRRLLDKYSGNKNKLKEETLKKFKGKNYPILTSKREFMNRIKKHYSIVPLILNGEIPSEFYGIARECRDQSSNDVMSSKDFMRIDLQKFIGGYYGMNRQRYISLEVKGKYQKELDSAAKVNKTIKFWSLDSFSLYVLANEVICRLVMEDQNCSIKQAYKIVRESTDYGKYVADDSALIDDLGEEIIESPYGSVEVASSDKEEDEDKPKSRSIRRKSKRGSDLKKPASSGRTSNIGTKRKSTESTQSPRKRITEISFSDESEDELDNLLKGLS